MGFIFEKINAVSSHKNHLIDIYSVEKIHDVVDACRNLYDCLKYLQEVDNIIENMVGQETTPEESLKFFNISVKHLKAFLLFDQINEKYGAEIYQLEDHYFKTAVFFFF